MVIAKTPTHQSSWPMHESKMLIGGQLVESESERRLSSVNPADETEIGSVPRGNAADIAHAVDAAAQAQSSWGALSMEQRANYLREVGRQLSARADEVLGVEVKDTGNTIGKMRADVSKAVYKFDYFAGICYELKGSTVPASAGNIHFSLREPYGVVGGIAPFNHPIMFAATRMAAPMMAGNTVVIKPSEQSPLSATILAEICAEIMPTGSVNIVTGLGDEAGDALVRHPKVKRIAFTGSVATGMKIQRAAAEVAVKHVSLELGGKNPMIVFPDADVSRAIPMAVGGMNFAWQGQSCGSTSRVLVHESLYDRFVAEIGERVAALKLGDPMDESSQMGPINSKVQYEKVLHYIDVAEADGARLVTGGKQPTGKQFERGYWVEPTVYADVEPAMRIAQEEVFGPILSIMKWRDIDEAVDLANSTQYGLTAAIWTENINTALQVGRRVQAGYVWINGVSGHYRGTSFGGFKNSGVGREEGVEELLGYTEEKSLHIILN